MDIESNQSQEIMKHTPSQDVCVSFVWTHKIVLLCPLSQWQLSSSYCTKISHMFSVAINPFQLSLLSVQINWRKKDKRSRPKYPTCEECYWLMSEPYFSTPYCYISLRINLAFLSKKKLFEIYLHLPLINFSTFL